MTKIMEGHALHITCPGCTNPASDADIKANLSPQVTFLLIWMRKQRKTHKRVIIIRCLRSTHNLRNYQLFEPTQIVGGVQSNFFFFLNSFWTRGLLFFSFS